VSQNPRMVIALIRRSKRAKQSTWNNDQPTGPRLAIILDMKRFARSVLLARLGRLTIVLSTVYNLVSLATPMAWANREENTAIVKTEMSRFLNEIPLIRVLVTDAPGLGNQSASATVVTRLRELGYKGHIQVIYQSKVVAQKLTYLLPPFDGNNTKSIQSFSELNMSFIMFPDFQQQVHDEAILAVSGADDLALGIYELKSKIALKLRPYQWKGNQILASWLDDHAKKLPHLDQLGYAISPPGAMESISEFVNGQLSHNVTFAIKIPGIQAILENTKRIELMPVYGHNIGYYPWQLSQIVTAVTMAQNASPTSFKGGVVIPVFSSINDFLWSKVANQKTSSRVKFLNITDPTLSKQVHALQAQETLVVKVGHIPKKLFEYFYFNSTMPPMVEGMNSINLMQLIGRPYFNSWKDEPIHFSNSSEIKHFSLQERRAYFLAMDASNELIKETTYLPYAAQFIIESKAKNSPVRELFKRFSIDPEKHLMQDKLFRGLIEVRKELKKHECEKNLLLKRS